MAAQIFAVERIQRCQLARRVTLALARHPVVDGFPRDRLGGRATHDWPRAASRWRLASTSTGRRARCRPTRPDAAAGTPGRVHALARPSEWRRARRASCGLYRRVSRPRASRSEPSDSAAPISSASAARSAKGCSPWRTGDGPLFESRGRVLTCETRGREPPMHPWTHHPCTHGPMNPWTFFRASRAPDAGGSLRLRRTGRATTSRRRRPAPARARRTSRRPRAPAAASGRGTATDRR